MVMYPVSHMKYQVIFIGADHAGFKLKEQLKKSLKNAVIEDLSPDFKAGDDYPIVSKRLAQAVTKTKEARGILVCGSGVGVIMAANRIKGARAFDAFDEKTVKLAREHNDANIMALSGWRQDAKTAKKLIGIFLNTKSSTAARHQRRVKQLG